MQPSVSDPLTVAVIGCGPAGMFYCHSIEKILREHRDRIPYESQTIQVTCFERAIQAGGVWRAEPDSLGSDPSKSVQMYAALWTNGPSHCIEFADYTFDEHFKAPVPVYLPRQAFLEYLIGRVTKHCPNFFEKYVKFCSDVEHVVYDDTMKKFRIRIRDLITGKSSVRFFDKCVWACGDNGKKCIPQNLLDVFQSFQGRLLHSAETAELEENVRGKRILLVGGGYSAEDLALQAIKWDVDKVFISVRSPESEVLYTKSWPMDKVEIVLNQAPSAVTECGSCIQFRPVACNWPYEYEFSGPVETELRDIDTVIFCTGYKMNMDMLEDSIRSEFEITTAQSKLDIPEGWKMLPNEMTPWLGDVAPGNCIYDTKTSVHPHLFRGMLISNPNMMFLVSYDANFPILVVDLVSWVLAAYTTQMLDIPSTEEMRASNYKEALDDMQTVYLRSVMDSNYYDALYDLEDFWPERYLHLNPTWLEVLRMIDEHQLKKFAGLMKETQYSLDIGTHQSLNDKGLALIRFHHQSSHHRYALSQTSHDKVAWITFRDYENCEKFYSIHTGTRAIPLPTRWLDIPDCWNDY